MSKPFFGFDITWALKKFFPETIELRGQSPNFDSHFDYLYLPNSRGKRVVMSIVFTFLNKTRGPYEVNDTSNRSL
jgi:hypothetical protein